MTTDDDDLGIDLDAWQPPPVPGGIADAVVAQMRQEHTQVTSVTAIEPERRGTKRIWLVAIPLVAAAVAGLVAFGIRRAPANGGGTVVAERPMHLGLGPSSAELDAGTHVTWKRERDRITATQTGGAATWRVDDDDTLTIDATVASIEATNASLRVEVKMIDNTKKTVATSAVTAAAVALVTIVVYEGTLKVTESGKTTQVAAGSAYQIKGPSTVIEEEAVVGTSAQVEQREQKVTEPDWSHDQRLPDKTAAKATCAFDELYAKGQEAFSINNWTGAADAFGAAYDCKHDRQALKLAAAAACRSKNRAKAKLYWAKMDQNARDQILSICVGAGITADVLNGAPSGGRAKLVGPDDAAIYVDGAQVGLGSIELDLVPGKHKVMFRVGDNRHTFAVNVRAGETVTLDKRALE